MGEIPLKGYGVSSSRRAWLIGVRGALILGVAVGFAACSGPSIPSSPIMTKEMVDQKNAGPAPIDGWQEKAAHSFELMGMKVDRIEWAAPAKGSYSRFYPRRPRELEKPEPGNERGTVNAYLKVVQVGFAGWFGCGWVHLAEPFPGINGPVVEVAIPLTENPTPNEAHLAIRASEICRYSTVGQPKKADGTLIPRPAYVRPQNFGEADVKIQSDGKWATSTQLGRDLIFFKVPEGSNTEEAATLFQMAMENPAAGKADDKYFTYRKSSIIISRRYAPKDN